MIAKKILFGLSILVALFMASPLNALAYDPFGGVDCSAGRNADSAVCSSKTKTNPLVGSDGLFAHIANIVAYVAGAAAIILIIIGGLRYITSGGDPQNAKKARDTVLYALIGVAVVILARTLIIFVLSKLK